MALTKVSNSILVQPVNHNILINPSFTVKQRGDVIDHNTTSYGPDRWKVRGIDAVGGTMSQSTTVVDPTTGINKLLVKHRNAAYSANTYQHIEAVNIQGMYGKEMTFSFSYSDTGGSGIPKVEVRSFDPTGTVKILYEAIPTSLGNDRWTCTFTLSTNDGTIPDPSERGIRVLIYPNEANAAPNEWSVWETKLEVGPVATPFIARQYGEELALCQRYYQSINFKATTPLTATRRNTNEIGMPVPLYAVMRATPTYSNTRDNNTDPLFTLKGDGNNEAFANPSIIYATGFALLAKSGLSTAVNNESAYGVSVQSGYLQFDAEI